MSNTVEIDIVNSRPADFAIAVAEAVKSALGKSEKPLLTAREVAALIGIGKSTWYTMKAEGKVPVPIKLGKRVLWHREEILEWVKAGCPDQYSWEKSKSYRS